MEVEHKVGGQTVTSHKAVGVENWCSSLLLPFPFQCGTMSHRMQLSNCPQLLQTGSLVEKLGIDLEMPKKN